MNLSVENQNNSNETNPSVVIIGGGFAGLQLVKRLKNKPFNVLLIDKNNYHTFQPLIYQVASGGLGSDSVAYPLRKTIGEIKNIRFRMANVERIDSENKQIITNTGNFKYDYLIIATGSTSNFFGNTDLETHSLPLKTIPHSLDLRSKILQEFEKTLFAVDDNAKSSILNFVIVGGGPTGVEISGALAEIRKTILPHDYKEIDPKLMKINLIEASPRLLASMSEIASQKAHKFLTLLGVNVMLNTSLVAFDGNQVKLSNNQIIQSKTVVWTAGVKGYTIEGINKESITFANRYAVDENMRLKNYENIFVVGDVACLVSDEYPKGHPMVAPVAIQQADIVADNLINLQKNIPLKKFKYKNLGAMSTVGRHKAVVDFKIIKFHGILAWYVWMFVHLMSIVGFRNRLLVFVNWMWNYFNYDRAIRLIIRPYIDK